MPMRAVLLLGIVAACHDTQLGNQPVGGSVDSDASIERFLRHAFLDLSGHPPSDSDLAATTQQLRDAGNTPSARRSVVAGLIAQDAFAKVWVGELENALFGGSTVDQQYALVCGIVRSSPGCSSCTAVDSCMCPCAAIAPLLTERTQLEQSAADFGSGTKSSTIERRYAMAEGYYALAGTPEARVTTEFNDFLARTAEADEIENGRAMIIGSLIQGSPAGLLFHRYGASYSDFIDIVFTSDIYREAVVRRVFLRYLAREPSPDELAHFSATLDATTPDVRDLVQAVTASREYFEQ
jgi:hypothetical protein